MAIVKQRLHRFNGSSYDTIHLETEKACITDFTHKHTFNDMAGGFSVVISDMSDLDNVKATSIVYVGVSGHYARVFTLDMQIVLLQVYVSEFDYLESHVKIRAYYGKSSDGSYHWSAWKEIMPSVHGES